MPPTAAPPGPPPQTALDAAGPVALQLYQDLLAAVQALGSFEVEVKGTSCRNEWGRPS